ncbi:hypothetical protein C8J57DRAFT_1330594, partial [Mycena rebaudengoi]
RARSARGGAGAAAWRARRPKKKGVCACGGGAGSSAETPRHRAAEARSLRWVTTSGKISLSMSTYCVHSSSRSSTVGRYGLASTALARLPETETPRRRLAKPLAGKGAEMNSASSSSLSSLGSCCWAGNAGASDRILGVVGAGGGDIASAAALDI